MNTEYYECLGSEQQSFRRILVGLEYKAYRDSRGIECEERT
jgi:hypothetical protein